MLKVIKFLGKSSSTRGIKIKKLQGGQFDPSPGLDRVKRPRNYVFEGGEKDLS